MTRATKTMAIGLAGLLAMTASAAAGDFDLRIGGVRGPYGGGAGGVAVRAGDTYVAVGGVRAPAVVPLYAPAGIHVDTTRAWTPTVETYYRTVPIYGPLGRIIGYRQEPYTVVTGVTREVHREVSINRGDRYAAYPPAYANAPYPHGGYAYGGSYGQVGCHH